MAIARFRSALLVPLVLGVESPAVSSPLLGDTQKPPALLAAELARDKATIRTGLVEYSIRESQPDPSGVTERFFTWRCAADGIVVVNRGDEVGVGMPWKESADGEVRGYSGVVHFLCSSGELWMHREDAIYADVWGPEQRAMHDVIDIRRLGLSPVGTDESYDEIIRAAGLPPVEYSVGSEGALTVVTGTTAAGKVRWWIDPEKNWNVVRTAVYNGDQMLGEKRFHLEEFDGVWFPRRIEHFAYGDGPTDVPRSITEFHYAEFNRPEHPQVLLPQHIGVEPGMWVTYQDGKTPGGIFDGAAIVEPADFLGRLARGEVRRGPNVTREIARIRAARRRAAGQVPVSTSAGAATQPSSRSVAAWESEWERYTRDFIERFALTDDQTQRALAILKDCQERGQRFVNGRRSEFDRIDGALAEARRSGDAKTVRVLEEQAAALRAPLDEIFERQLKPRLDRLPTRQQRALAAEATPRPTSAPARP